MNTQRKSVRNVLQVNVRLSEGGAAGVARTLADGLRIRGVDGRFAYGYGRRGADSPLHQEYKGLRVTSAPVAAFNRGFFPIAGRETHFRSKQHWRSLREAVKLSDVVHLHAIHSYMANVEDIVSLLIEEEKPVVWTMHDQWIFTGRCAQPGACRLFESGCASCPNLKAYQPGLIDRAREEWPKRRASLQRLYETGKFELISCASWLRDEALAAGLPVGRVVANSVDLAFWQAAQSSKVNADDPVNGKTRVLFVSRDLRDPVKVDWELLRRISRRKDIVLTIVGDNPPEHLEGVRHVPAVRDRGQLALLFGAHDAILFTSKVDYFPLTLVEAAVAGLAIVAVDSPAAREFVDYQGLVIRDDSSKLELELSNVRRRRRHYDVSSTGRYAPERMVDDYLAVYEELVTR